MIAPQKWHHNQSQNQHNQTKKTVFNQMRFAYVGRDVHYIDNLPVTNTKLHEETLSPPAAAAAKEQRIESPTDVKVTLHS